MAETRQVEGFLASLEPRGETSALVRILTGDGFLMATAPRSMLSGKKSFPLGAMRGTLASFDVVRRRVDGPLSVISHRPLEKLFDCSSRLEDSLFVQLVEELVRECLEDCGGELFQPYARCFQLARDGHLYPGLCCLLTQGIKLLGIGPQTRRCGSCGSEGKLVSFSLERGGFLCRSCAGGKGLDRDTLLSWRYVFEADPESAEYAKLAPGFLSRACRECIAFIEDYFGVRIQTFPLFSSAAEQARNL